MFRFKRFSNGHFVRFISNRTGEVMLQVDKIGGTPSVSGVTPMDDVSVDWAGDEVRIGGSVYDTQGLVLRFLANGQEQIHADATMEENLTGRERRGLLVGRPELHQP
jgi:hypothetical protein